MFCPNQTRPEPAQDGPQHVPVRVAASGSSVWVSVNGGSDSNPGTESRPVQTLARALALSRAATAKPVTILVQPGTYRMSSPLILTAEDQDLTIAGTEPGVWLSGAQALTDLQWAPYNVSNTTWQMLANMNNAKGCAKDTPSDPICPCHQVQTLDECTAFAESTNGVKSFTWHDSTCGLWQYQCCVHYDNAWAPYSEAGHFSGRRSGGTNIWVATLPDDITTVPQASENENENENESKQAGRKKRGWKGMGEIKGGATTGLL